MRPIHVIDLEARIEALPRESRVALAATCIERVLPMFDAMSEHDGAPLRDAVALAWRFARRDDVPRDAIRAAREKAQHLLPNLEEEPGTMPRLLAAIVHATTQLLSAIDPSSEHPATNATNAVRRAYEAVFRFEDLEDVDRRKWTRAEEVFHDDLLLAAARGEPLDGVVAPTAWVDRLDEEWS